MPSAPGPTGSSPHSRNPSNENAGRIQVPAEILERGSVVHLTPFFESGKLPGRHPIENLRPVPRFARTGE